MANAKRKVQKLFWVACLKPGSILVLDDTNDLGFIYLPINFVCDTKKTFKYNLRGNIEEREYKLLISNSQDKVSDYAAKVGMGVFRKLLLQRSDLHSLLCEFTHNRRFSLVTLTSNCCKKYASRGE